MEGALGRPAAYLEGRGVHEGLAATCAEVADCMGGMADVAAGLWDGQGSKKHVEDACKRSLAAATKPGSIHAGQAAGRLNHLMAADIQVGQ